MEEVYYGNLSSFLKVLVVYGAINMIFDIGFFIAGFIVGFIS